MTHEEGTQNSPIRAVYLEGDEESRFLRRFQGIIRAARLSNQYPDGRRIGAHAGALSPEIHRGLYKKLEINVDSGLPTYKEWTRVQTDVSIAADQLRQLGTREGLAKKAKESSHAIHAQQLNKYDYYNQIADIRLAPLGAMDIALRRIDARANEAHFYVVFDKLDVSGVFIRFQISLSQKAQVWNSAAVTLNEDTASYTDEFKSLIYKFSSLDAEFTYTKLATLPGVTVERISRGTLGPIFCADLMQRRGITAPEPFDKLLEKETDFVAHFGMDIAAKDVAENRNNDPFGALFESELSRKMRPTYAQARDSFGYKVYKDRKFVVSRGMEGKLREFCTQLNTQNIIYSL